MDALETRPIRADLASEATLPTRFGEFRMCVFTNNRDANVHVAMVRGDVFGASDVSARVHFECRAGDVLGSLRCDCKGQLERAMEELASLPCGVLVYVRRGVDTVDANHALGREDQRDYAIAAAMLRTLGVRSVRLPVDDQDTTLQLDRHLDGSA